MSKQKDSRSGTKVVIERTLRASLEEVWDLWTTKEGFESWWGPQGFRSEVREIDAQVGGPLHFEMIADTPEMVEAMKQMGRPSSHGVRARFIELSPCERLVLTGVVDFLPGVAPYENNIAVDFFSVEGGVRMVVTLDAMHSEEFTKMTEEGFVSQLTKLERRYS